MTAGVDFAALARVFDATGGSLLLRARPAASMALGARAEPLDGGVLSSRRAAERHDAAQRPGKAGAELSGERSRAGAPRPGTER